MIATVFKTVLRWSIRAGLLVLLLLVGPGYVYLSDRQEPVSWSTASRISAGLAPSPEAEPGAVIQVYAARTFGWRGAFAVHTWIATKRAYADSYRTHHVIGWYSGNKIRSSTDIPDRYWYGAAPSLVLDMRGDGTEDLIDKVEDAVASYPFAEEYRAWPGPNSNTFIAWIGRSVPELELEMPPLAVGKDYLGRTRFADFTPSHTGLQFNLAGLLGITAAAREGLEVNILGLSLGVDPLDMNLSLPGIGRIGPDPNPARP
ncbi:MAG: DUF3750 domain-containing protein [Alphaproteobacteria bacterium]|uniref:DUF3750 domain-containing protein n=1 Tax=Pacificispira sp. TaxID=2888761 RepID=UPI001B0A063B|nr:DUF3750 domain-containing protein [Alphaproteobacteria bacterium]MBO6863134.1 DUF3750 domain-containing protein [Alphaproteobacteria bacterium]